jgi:long-chain acyl-CoA synthetase
MIVDEIRSFASAHPDRPALIADGDVERQWTYRELMSEVDRAAGSLRDSGFRTGERCGMLAPQGADFIIHGLALLQAGLCFVPLSEDYAGEALDGFIRDAKLHCLLRAEKACRPERLPDPGPVDGRNDRDYLALQPAYLRFTSGTTNTRKGVIIGHDAILDRLAAANRGLQIAPGDRILWTLPMAHHFVVSILLYLRYGATILLPSGSSGAAMFQLAHRHRATVFYASPYHYDLLAKDSSGLRLDALRLAISTTSGLNLHVAEAFHRRTGHHLSQALGVIEAGMPVMNLARAAEKPLCLGQVLPDYQVWLRGEDGRPVEGDGTPERAGEICIRGPGFFGAYLNPWIPAKDLLQPDGFRTGDQGWFDADGDLHLLGRRHNRINMAGMKFFCEEVEAVIDRFPGIKESKVYGKPHAKVGEIPVAELVAENPSALPDLQALNKHCHQHLALHKVPIAYHWVDNLPRTSTGKIKRW